MGGENDDARSLDQSVDALLGTLDKPHIAGAKALIEDQNFRLDRRCDGETQPGQHPGRIGADRKGHKIAEFGKLFDLGGLFQDLAARHAQKQPAGEHILVSVSSMSNPGAVLNSGDSRPQVITFPNVG